MGLSSPSQPQSGAVRLYVGGLPHDIRPEQLAQRFQPFGAVHAVELIPEKAGDVSGTHPLKPCRGFAYVQLVPKDDTSLRRCVSMYNGCKWMGGVLRVEPARLHFTQKHKAEEAAELDAQKRIEEEALRRVRERTERAAAAIEEGKALSQMKVLRKDGKKVMQVQANRAKTYFPPMKPPPAAKLSWDPVETPPGSAAHIQRTTLASAEGLLRKVDKKIDPTPPAESPKELSAPGRPQPLEPLKEEEKAVEEEQPVSESSEELGAVDFLSSEDEMQGKAAMHEDRRFDSSDDDDSEGTAKAAPLLLQRRFKPVLTASKGGMGTLSEAVQLRPLAAGAAAAAAAESPRPAEGVDARDLGAGEALHSVEGILVRYVEKEGPGSLTNTGKMSNRSALANAEASEMLAAPTEQDADLSKPQTTHSIGSLPAAVVGVYECSSGETSSSSDEGQDGSSGLEIEEAIMEEDEEDKEPRVSAPGREPGRAETMEDAAVSVEDRTSSDCVMTEKGGNEPQQGSASGVSASGRAGQCDLRANNQASLAELAAIFPSGAAFCRGTIEGDAEAAWRANREHLVADYKSKRRTALRKITSSKRGRCRT